MTPTLALKAAEIAARGLVAPDPVGGTWVAVMLKPDAASIEKILPYAKTPADQLHMTLVMCGKTDDLKARGYSKETLVGALKSVADWNTPLDAKIGGVTRFHAPEDAGKDPVVLSINSRRLADLRTQVIAALQQAGLHEETEHGYTPHLTIGYLPQNAPLTIRHFPLTDITFDRILIGFGGDYAELTMSDNGMHDTPGFKGCNPPTHHASTVAKGRQALSNTATQTQTQSNRSKPKQKETAKQKAARLAKNAAARKRNQCKADEFDLDYKGDRYVRTEAGARFYGQPIGSLIVAGPSVRLEGVPGHIDKRDPNIHEPYDDRNTWCYQHAAQYAMANSTPEEGPSLVHGQVQISPRMPAINHSWVVWPDGKVFEPNTGHLMTQQEFDDFFHPVVEAEYTPQQMREEIVKHHNWGPWHEGLRVSDVIARVLNAALHLAGKKHLHCDHEEKSCPSSQTAAQALKKQRQAAKKAVAPKKATGTPKRTGKNAKASLRQQAGKTAKAIKKRHACMPANTKPYQQTGEQTGRPSMKDVFNGMPGLITPFQHGNPVPRKKRRSARAIAIELASNGTQMKSAEFKKAPKDGDGDGFINDATHPTPTPPGTPVSKHTTFVGPSDYAGAHTIEDGSGQRYLVGNSGGEWFAVTEPKDEASFWDGEVATGPTAKGMMRALDSYIAKHGGAQAVQKAPSARAAAKRVAQKKPGVQKDGTYVSSGAAASSARHFTERVSRGGNAQTRAKIAKDIEADPYMSPAQKDRLLAKLKEPSKTAAKKTTRKAKVAKDPNAFGPQGGQQGGFQVAGQNETATLEGEPVVGARKNYRKEPNGARQMTKIKPGSKTEAYLRKKYGIADGYDNIRFNHSRDEKKPDDTYDGLVYVARSKTTGKDAYVYTTRWRALANGAKENTVGQLSANFNKVAGVLKKDAYGKDEKKKIAARALMVQALTGLRIGNAASAAQGSFGASNLQARHVTLLSNNKVKIAFKGKGRHKRLDDQGNPLLDESGKPIWDAGKDYSITVQSKDLHDLMADAKIGKRPGDPLFGNADHNAYLKNVSSALGLKPAITAHNFRHNFATMRAMGLVEKIGRQPQSEAAFQAHQKKIVEQVAALINDTKKVAFASYIQPSVWDALRGEPEWKDAKF